MALITSADYITNSINSDSYENPYKKGEFIKFGEAIPILKTTKRMSNEEVDKIDKLNDIAVSYNNTVSQIGFDYGMVKLVEPRKTFKFLGMDIDDEFNIVCKLSNFDVIIGSLFSIVGDFPNYQDYPVITKKNMRKIVTKLKTETMYDLVREFKYANEYVANYDSISHAITTGNNDIFPRVNDFLDTKVVEHIKNINKLLSDYSYLDSNYNKKTSGYKSIFMNLLSESEKKRDESKGIIASNNEKDPENKMWLSFTKDLFKFFSVKVDRYSSYKIYFGMVDLFTEYINILLDKSKNIEVLVLDDESDDPMNMDSITINASGVAKDLNAWGLESDSVRSSIVDLFIPSIHLTADLIDAGNIDNIEMHTYDFKGATYKFMKDIRDMYSNFVESGPRYIGDYLFDDVLLSNISDDDYVSGLSDTDMQALSIIDSLRYLDDVFYSASKTYDLSDESQRLMLFESVMDSYSRNFVKLKNENNDIIDSISKTIDDNSVNGVEKIFKGSTYSDKEDSEMGGTILNPREVYYTATEKQALVREHIEMLGRVLKMSNKVFKTVLDDFNN